MILTPVEKIPKKIAGKKGNIISILEEFSKMDASIVKIDGAEEHYKTTGAMVSTFRNAIKRSGFPMKVYSRDKKLYLSKIE